MSSACAVASGWNLAYIVIGTAWAAASLGFLGATVLASGGRR